MNKNNMVTKIIFSAFITMISFSISNLSAYEWVQQDSSYFDSSGYSTGYNTSHYNWVSDGNVVDCNCVQDSNGFECYIEAYAFTDIDIWTYEYYPWVPWEYELEKYAHAETIC